MNDCNAVLIDYETLAKYPHDCVVLDCSVIPFNTNSIDSFDDLVSRGFHMKFDVDQQINELHRQISRDTVDWWMKQDQTAKGLVVPSAADQPLLDFVTRFESWLAEINIDLYRMKVFARGSSFDIGIMRSIYYAAFGGDYDTRMPFRYWNERDVRTYIDAKMEDSYACLGVKPGQVPVPSHMLTGFVKHNSVHDCAKDIIAMQISRTICAGDTHVLEGADEYTIV